MAVPRRLGREVREVVVLSIRRMDQWWLLRRDLLTSCGKPVGEYIHRLLLAELRDAWVTGHLGPNHQCFVIFSQILRLRLDVLLR